jgi:UDP-4-amino-4,6-dideoxy-N-acetyl-beta-L-altrosamine N-acetyltransferase
MIQIDRQKIYESHGFKFKNFVCLTDEEKVMILKWRNHENVRSLMVNKEEITFENHLKFLESLKNRTDCYYWLVTDNNGVNLGVMDIIHINDKEDTGEIGFYLNQEELGRGFEFMIESLYFVFAHLKLGNNIVTVDVNNKDIVLFNRYIGTTFEGVKDINGQSYYYSNQMKGDYLVTHYDEFSLIDYARYIRRINKK